MKNEINNFNDRSEANTFDLREMRIALSCWLEHGDSSFDMLKKEDLEVIPIIRTMQRHYVNLREEEVFILRSRLDYLLTGL